MNAAVLPEPVVAMMASVSLGTRQGRQKQAAGGGKNVSAGKRHGVSLWQPPGPYKPAPR